MGMRLALLLVTAVLFGGCAVDLVDEAVDKVDDSLDDEFGGVADAADVDNAAGTVLDELGRRENNDDETIRALIVSLNAKVDALSTEVADLQQTVANLNDVDAQEVADTVKTELATDFGGIAAAVATELSDDFDSVVLSLEREVVFQWDSTLGDVVGTGSDLVAAMEAGRPLTVATRNEGSTEWSIHQCIETGFNAGDGNVVCHAGSRAGGTSATTASGRVGGVPNMNGVTPAGIGHTMITSSGVKGSQTYRIVTDTILAATTNDLAEMVWTAAP